VRVRPGAHEILDRVKLRRILTVVPLLALAMGALSACETKVGLAASASGQRLTNSGLAGYVKPGAKPYTDQNTGTKVTPKLYALENWIDYRLFSATLAAHGGPATDQEASTARTAVLGSQTANDYAKFYGKLGYTRAFSELILDQSSTLVVLVERLGQLSPAQAIQVLRNGQASTPLLQAVNATKPKVVVSPRYGEWDASRLSLSAEPGSGAPGFVIFPGAKGNAQEPAPAG
jgi:hypothetical protein